jgi:hypothetical protein
MWLASRHIEICNNATIEALQMLDKMEAEDERNPLS